MIRVEFRKQILRLRTWVAFAVLVGVPAIATIATKINPEEPGPNEGPSFAAFSDASGLNNAVTALGFMSLFFLVIVAAMFAGETIAGEANWGTLRYLLVRPVRRPRLLLSKLGVSLALMGGATAMVSLSSLAIGTLAFGWHPFKTPFLVSIDEVDGLVRLLVATVLVAISLMPVATFALLLSTLTDIPAGAIGGAFGFWVVSQILDGISGLGPIRSGLPSHYSTAWLNLFFPTSVDTDILRSVGVAAVYSLVFVCAALWWFGRKDVLS